MSWDQPILSYTEKEDSWWRYLYIRKIILSEGFLKQTPSFIGNAEGVGNNRKVEIYRACAILKVILPIFL